MIDIAIGLYGLQDWFDGDMKSVIEAVQLADKKGIDQVSLTDHVVMGENLDRYPYGDFPAPLDYPWYEPISVLSAIAGCTDNIRLSTGILIGPLRPAVLLAKQLATLDVISRGRVDIGIGAGWQREEYEASGLPFDTRFQHMEDQVKVCRALWSEAPASLDLETVKLDRIHSRPFPPQGKDIPIWFGIKPLPKNVKRIAELGDGWIPITYNPEVVAAGVKDLRAGFKAVDRDPDELAVRVQLKPVFTDDGVPDLEATLEGLDDMIKAGATMLEVLPVMFCRGPDDLEAFYTRILQLKG